MYAFIWVMTFAYDQYSLMTNLPKGLFQLIPSPVVYHSLHSSTSSSTLDIVSLIFTIVEGFSYYLTVALIYSICDSFSYLLAMWITLFHDVSVSSLFLCFKQMFFFKQIIENIYSEHELFCSITCVSSIISLSVACLFTLCVCACVCS